MRYLSWTLGFGLLLFQVGGIVYARFVESRYFCWAPYDMQTQYRVAVNVNGEELNGKQIRERYRRSQAGSDNRSPQHLKDIFSQTDASYHPEDAVVVVLRYRVNGKEERTWRFVRNTK